MGELPIFFVLFKIKTTIFYRPPFTSHILSQILFIFTGSYLRVNNQTSLQIMALCFVNTLLESKTFHTPHYTSQIIFIDPSTFDPLPAAPSDRTCQAPNEHCPHFERRINYWKLYKYATKIATCIYSMLYVSYVLICLQLNIDYNVFAQMITCWIGRLIKEK